MFKFAALATCLSAGVMLPGCTTLLNNESVLAVIDDTVVRMEVTWGETAEHSWTPASYALGYWSRNWTVEDNRYRWVLTQAVLRRDIWGQAFRPARVPDGLPILRPGDLVDVYLPRFADTNYGELVAPVIVRLVCSDADSECKKRSKSDLGGRNEIVSRGKPDMANLSFSKVYGLDGKRQK